MSRNAATATAELSDSRKVGLGVVRCSSGGAGARALPTGKHDLVTDRAERRDAPARGLSELGSARPGSVDTVVRVLQGMLALWLLVAPVVLQGPSWPVAVKDVLVGGLLLTLTLAAAAGSGARRYEGSACLGLGAVLIVASVLLEFGSGAETVVHQWNEVVVGVLLVCLGAARARA